MNSACSQVSIDKSLCYEFVHTNLPSPTIRQNYSSVTKTHAASITVHRLHVLKPVQNTHHADHGGLTRNVRRLQGSYLNLEEVGDALPQTESGRLVVSKEDTVEGHKVHITFAYKEYIDILVYTVHIQNARHYKDVGGDILLIRKHDVIKGRVTKFTSNLSTQQMTSTPDRTRQSHPDTKLYSWTCDNLTG